MPLMVIVIIAFQQSMTVRFYRDCHRLAGVKVAAKVRVPIRRCVIRIRIRKTVIAAIVPITTKTNGTHNVRINEVGIAFLIPVYIISHCYEL